MSNIILGKQSAPHWAQRVGDFLGNMGAEQRRQREIEEQQKQQMMQQEIERARQYVKSAADPNAALQQVPEELRQFVTYETYRDPMAQQERKIKEAQLAERGNLYGLGGGQPQQQQPQARPFDFAVDGRVDAPHPQQMPQPQQAPQQGGSIAESVMNKLMKIRDMYGDEAMKSSAKLIMATGLPDNEEMDVLRTELGRLVDANTQYTQDATTGRTEMEQEGQNYRHRTVSGDQSLQSQTQVQTARMAQEGADSRHDRPSADATVRAGQTAAAKPPTGAERRTLNFLMRADDASQTLNGIEDKIQKSGTASKAQMKYMPGILQTKDQQIYEQAQRQFTEARLRKDSGAAIKEEEYKADQRTYFVQPGDSDAVVKRKRLARGVILKALRQESGRAYDEFYGESANSGGAVGGGEFDYDPASGGLVRRK
jgi:hypothetical protein